MQKQALGHARARRGWTAVVSTLTVGCLAQACAHQPAAPKPPLSSVAQSYAAQADAFGVPQVEEDFLEARLVFQTLPVYAPARQALRSRLLQYLLAPLENVTPADLQGDASGLVATEYDQQVLASFQDALTLFHPSELVGPLTLPPLDQQRLLHAAGLVRTVFGAQGAEIESAVSLAVLNSLQPEQSRWNEELNQVLSWAENGKQMAAGNSQLEAPLSPRRILEETTWRWPTPALAQRLGQSMVERHQQLTGRLRRPLGGGVHAGMFGEEMLEEVDNIATLAPSLAAVHLRTGNVKAASEALKNLENHPGENPELRKLVDAVAFSTNPSSGAFADLARRFLPKLPLLDGTSTDRVDAWAAFRVLELGLRFHPQHADLLILQSRVARLVNAPLLALRLLEEAEPLLRQQKAPSADQKGLAKEIVELQFALFRLRMDPEDVAPAQKHAQALQRRMAEARRVFGQDNEWLSEAPVQIELARNYVDAGLSDRAEPILEQAVSKADASVEVTLQLGNLLIKKDQLADAVRLLRDAFERHQPEDPPQETIGYVENHAKLARALGQALDLSGRDAEAQKAYRMSLVGWERLMVDHVRNQRRTPAAEARVEVGRLYYVMGRQEEGLQKLSEAVALDDSRDQTYTDALSFLVQRGELEAAIDIFRRAISRSGDSVSEYVKVYASLWIQDLSRRSGHAPDPSAQAYLNFIAHRKLSLRPSRTSAWYRQLARFAIGEATFDELLAQATTSGRKAELFFYQAMQQLAQGKEDDAHKLWTRVLETNMVSFFEYEMASHYLRQGAQAQPKDTGSHAGEAI